jgi:FG-GAP-like repeat
MIYSIYAQKKTSLLLIVLGVTFMFMFTFVNKVNAATLFEEPVNYIIGDLGDGLSGGDLSDVVAEDLNGDGYIDIAGTIPYPAFTENEIPNPDEGIVILLNDGEGVFSISQYVAFGENHTDLSAGDYDSDGDIDLASVKSNLDSVSVLFNNGSGNFNIEYNIETSQVPEILTQADYDSDGDIDFAVTVSSGIRIFTNNGEGDFIETDIISTTVTPSSIDSGDIDNDGDIDLIGGTRNGVAILIVALNSGDGTFVSSETTILEPDAGDAPEFVEIKLNDIDGDSDVDIVAALDGAFPLSIVTLLNDGAGIFTIGNLISNGQTNNISLSDLDTDGDIDILATDSGINEVYLLDNDGLGNFSTETVATLAFGFFTSIVSADLNNDNNKDIIVSAASQYGVWVILQIAPEEETPAQQASALVTAILDLDIPNNLENSYLANLFKVEGFIENGQSTPAINQLTAFINKVNQDYSKGTLTQTDRDDLVSAAQQLIDNLSN